MTKNARQSDSEQVYIMRETTGPVLCLQVDQPVINARYNGIYLPTWRRIVEAHGEIRILYFYPDPDNFPGWEESVAEQDLRQFTAHGREVKKVAIVDAPEKVRMRWQLIRPLLGGEVMNFGKDELEKALDWIRA